MNAPGRGSREAGKATRQTLLRAAAEVFTEHGETASVAQICAGAGTYPNQVTYYFGSKDQLFVEVACGAVLRAGRAAEEAAATATTVGEYTHALISTLLGAQARNVELFTMAMSMASRRVDLRPQIAETLAELHERGAEALMRTLMRTGWELRAPIDVEAKAFWSAIFGLVIQQAVAGDQLGYRPEDAVEIVFTNLQIPEKVLGHAI